MTISKNGSKSCGDLSKHISQQQLSEENAPPYGLDSGIFLEHVNEFSCRVYSRFSGVRVSGFLRQVHIPSCGSYAWQYQATLLRHPLMVKIASAPNDGTMWKPEHCIERIKKAIDEEFFQKCKV